MLKESLKFLKKDGLIYIEVPDEKASKKGKTQANFVQIICRYLVNYP